MKWTELSFESATNLNDETMDAYELGWRTRPSDKLLIELSLISLQYQKCDFFRSLHKYEPFDVKTNGGELTFNYTPIILGIYKGAILIPAVKKKVKSRWNSPSRWLTCRLTLKSETI